MNWFCNVQPGLDSVTTSLCFSRAVTKVRGSLIRAARTHAKVTVPSEYEEVIKLDTCCALFDLISLKLQSLTCTFASPCQKPENNDYTSLNHF